jgi:hypothetical protein
MHIGTIAPAVPFLGAAAPAFADAAGLYFVGAIPFAVAGLAIALAFVLGGLWLARRGRRPIDDRKPIELAIDRFLEASGQREPARRGRKPREGE